MSGRGCSSAATTTGPLRPRDGHRRDFVGQPAGRHRCPGALLASRGECVLIVARDPPLGRHVLGGLGHRMRAVQLLHPRVHEPPAQRGVLERNPPRERACRPCSSRTARATCSRRRRRSRDPSRRPRWRGRPWRPHPCSIRTAGSRSIRARLPADRPAAAPSVRRCDCLPPPDSRTRRSRRPGAASPRRRCGPAARASGRAARSSVRTEDSAPPYRPNGVRIASHR